MGKTGVYLLYIPSGRKAIQEGKKVRIWQVEWNGSTQYQYHALLSTIYKKCPVSPVRVVTAGCAV